MNEISKARFVCSLVLLTIGFGLLVALHGIFGWLLIYVSGLISNWGSRARASLNRPMRLSDVIWMFLVLAGWAAGLRSQFWVITSFQIGQPNSWAVS